MTTAPFRLSADRPAFDQVPNYDPSLSLTGNPAYHPSTAQKVALVFVGIGAGTATLLAMVYLVG